MRIVRLGESAWILRDWGDRRPYEVARSIAAAGLDGVSEAVPALQSVGVYGEPDVLDPDALVAAATVSDGAGAQATSHTIPVCYELGEDFFASCERLCLSPSEFIELHSGAEFTCEAIGFCPGFPYLSGLPEKLAGLPRLEVPRVRVSAGSVALAYDQAGIYPLERPGGWRLIGRTPLILVDVGAKFFPIEPGDRVRFAPISESEFEDRRGERL
jgi:inhibitor of KinA